MAKRQETSVLNRLSGKKLFFSGKFDYGMEASLKIMADAQQGKVLRDLDNSVDYLVLADLNAGKTIQKKALALNGKGASIQVIDVDAFTKLAEPTPAEILALLRTGESEAYGKIRGRRTYHNAPQTTKHTFHSENLTGATIEKVSLDDIAFEVCNFLGAELDHAVFGSVNECDFSKAFGSDNLFGDAKSCRFIKAQLKSTNFGGDLSEADFTSATLASATFNHFAGYRSPQKRPHVASVFVKCNLQAASFNMMHWKSPDFSGADLTGATFHECIFESATFCDATLHNAILIGSQLSGANFANADLTGANLSQADLTGANFAKANLKNANLRGAKLNGVDFSQAKNYDPAGTATGTTGPALTELDTINQKAKRIHVTFRVCAAVGEEGDAVGIDSQSLHYGYGLQLPHNLASARLLRRGQSLSFSDALLQLANVLGSRQVRYETVEVSSTKSPTGGKELRDLVMQGIVEAFAQELPPEEELAAATKKHRDAEREKGAAQREQLEQVKAEAEKQKEKAKQQIAKQVEKAVGQVTDIASFLKALEVRIEKPKIDKATKMLKASGFKLFNDVTDEHVSGVVKSQTDADLVYACSVDHEGHYSCCTQNLNVCGGLRGSICKHLLVLIIGLVQAGELDPTTIDAWIAKTHSTKPELDKENMGAIFIKYKGAEAGEVDWRPTETVPEDYYSL